MNYPDLKRKVVSVWEHYMKFNLGQVPVIIEDKASGQSIIQDLSHSTRIPLVASEAVLSKQVRMSDQSPLIEGGRCYLPVKAPWLVEYETEMARFPLWKWDNLVDSTSQFLKWAGRPQYKRSKKLKFWK
jgi:predicted phage terminase large subunit-like protein